MTEDPYSDARFQFLINRIAQVIFEHEAVKEDYADRLQYQEEVVDRVEVWVDKVIALERHHGEWLKKQKPVLQGCQPYPKEREKMLCKLLGTIGSTRCGERIAMEYMEGRATYGSKIAVRTDDGVTNEQLSDLSLVSSKTIQNKASQTMDRPKAVGRNGKHSLYCYQEQRAWLLDNFQDVPADRLPEDYHSAMNLISPKCPLGN